MKIILIVEWSGARPPTKWYNWLSSLGIQVGDETPLRSGGKALQGGILFFDNLSQARAVALLAENMGASSIKLGKFSEISPLAEKAKAEMSERFEQTLGRRGRPPLPSPYTVTCMDEMETFEVNHQPLFCPSCGSFSVNFREGTKDRFKTPEGTMLQIWLTTRFQQVTV